MKFDDILAGCIQAIEQGATVEECLQRYPSHAAALEPLLRMMVSLAHESKTQMSSQAFARGRALLAARTRQRQLPQDAIAIQHRRPPAPGAPQLRSAPGFPAQHNGILPRRLWSAKRAHRGWGVPRFLGIALLLMWIMGATTFIRSVVVSLPGAPLYSVKNTGEQVVEILMEAAGEDLAWHAGQTERRLQEMARLPQAEIATVQTLSRATEEHWASVLAAVQQLPAEERSVILQARLARLQELEAAWATLQGATPSVATMTVRKLITAGEQLLAEPAAADILATATDTVTPTALPTNTATPLLQATPTALQPVLVASATPTLAPTATLAPATATALPPLPPTAVPPVAPLPEITLAIPRQENADDDSTTSDPTPSNPEEDEDDSEESPSPPDESVVATPMPSLASEDTTSSVTSTVATAMATLVVTADATLDATLTVIPITEQPSATAESSTSQATATRTALPPTVTPAPELSATSTSGPKPTSQPAATKTPKPTATHGDEDDETETPDATDASTPAPPTPAPTTQPVISPSPSPQEATISAPATPIANPTTTARPTMPSGEVTKVAPP